LHIKKPDLPFHTELTGHELCSLCDTFRHVAVRYANADDLKVALIGIPRVKLFKHLDIFLQIVRLIHHRHIYKQIFSLKIAYPDLVAVDTIKLDFGHCRAGADLCLRFRIDNTNIQGPVQILVVFEFGYNKLMVNLVKNILVIILLVSLCRIIYRTGKLIAARSNILYAERTILFQGHRIILPLTAAAIICRRHLRYIRLTDICGQPFLVPGLLFFGTHNQIIFGQKNAASLCRMISLQQGGQLFQ